MKLTIRSMFDGHWMGSITAYSDRDAKVRASDLLRYECGGTESGTGDNDIAGLYGPRNGFHGVVNLPRVQHCRK